MFEFPTEGAIEVDGHPTAIFLQWLELNLIFGNVSPISIVELADEILEEEILQDHDAAIAFCEEAFEALRARSNQLSPQNQIYSFNNNEMSFTWHDEWLSYAFFTFLGFSQLYKASRIFKAADYVVHGSLFEQVSCEVLKKAFPGFRVERFGAGPKGGGGLAQVKTKVSTFLGFPQKEHLPSDAGDAKLDVILAWPIGSKFHFSWICFVQCASGENWPEKCREISISEWKEMIHIKAFPLGGIIIPFAIDESELFKHAIRVDGILLDRIRLFAGIGRTSLTPALQSEVLKWVNKMRPRLKSFAA